MELGLIGLDEIAGKKERKEKREKRQEERREKKEDRKEKREEKKKERKEKREDRKEKRQDKRADRKEKRKEKKEARGGSRAKKFFLAPARAAFFLLMKINFLQLRKKLRAAWQKDKAKVQKDIVRKFGFKEDNFLKELNRKEDSQLSAFLGTDPATGTAVAQATPIIVAVTKLLTSLGVAAGALTKAKDSLTGKDKELADEFSEGVSDDIANTPEDQRSEGGGQSPEDYREKPELEGGGGMGGKLPLYLGIGAAALAVLYFVSKKK